MRFDDRLKTVLAQQAASPHDAAVRWRQLVELAARAPLDGDRALVADAIREIREAAPRIDERVRSAAALAVASLLLPVDLVAAFAADRLQIAAPILAGARLTASEWKVVASAASDDCRAFIATMRSEAPSTQSPPAMPEPTSRERDPPHSIPSISDVVARIERLRQSRELAELPQGNDVPSSERPRLFRWECNESGEIEWVDGAPRGAIVGQSISQRGSGGGVDRTVERAFASRAPFHDGVLEMPCDSAIGGSWKIGGIPAFDRSSGRFAGYRGIAERVDESADSAAAATDPHALRELAHEIKTPLNAIVGFAEIIAGEYLGPAGSAYRERAGEIVGQARLLLNAIDDLDFAAKFSSTSGDNARSDLGEIVDRVAAKLLDMADERHLHVESQRTTATLDAAIQAEVAERLILRMCAAVFERADEGEHLQLTASREGAHCVVSITRPDGTSGLDDEALFGNGNDALSPAFPLRLARGLAQTAGASLTASQERFSLRFPAA